MTRSIALSTSLACILLLSSLLGASAQGATGAPGAMLADPRAGAAAPVRIAGVATSTGLPGVMMVGLYASDRSVRSWYSLNRGQTWQPLATAPWWRGYFFTAVAPREDGSPRFLALAFPALYRSGDYGATWHRLVFGTISVYDTVEAFVASRLEPRRFYFVHGWIECMPGFCDTNVWPFRSDDAGVTWQSLGTKSSWWYSVVPSPVVPARVYMRNDEGWFQSNDAGESWFPLGGWRIQELIPDSSDGLWLYSPSGRSSDGGASWVPWPQPPCPSMHIFAHPTKARVLLAYCDEETLYRSLDGGDHWEQLPPPPIAQGKFAPDDSTPGRILWVGVSDLWASADDGQSWTHLFTAPQASVFLPLLCTSCAAGIAATDATHP
jgi:hypothetical protein